MALRFYPAAPGIAESLATGGAGIMAGYLGAQEAERAARERARQEALELAKWQAELGVDVERNRVAELGHGLDFQSAEANRLSREREGLLGREHQVARDEAAAAERRELEALLHSYDLEIEAIRQAGMDRRAAMKGRPGGGGAYADWTVDEDEHWKQFQAALDVTPQDLTRLDNPHNAIMAQVFDMAPDGVARILAAAKSAHGGTMAAAQLSAGSVLARLNPATRTRILERASETHDNKTLRNIKLIAEQPGDISLETLLMNVYGFEPLGEPAPPPAPESRGLLSRVFGFGDSDYNPTPNVLPGTTGGVPAGGGAPPAAGMAPAAVPGTAPPAGYNPAGRPYTGIHALD